MFDVAIHPDTNLTGSIDLQAVLARYPAHYLVKGMFCSRLVEALGDQFAALAPRLIAPPRTGRYLPFHDYPASDYTQIVVASAAKQYSGLDLREATRRVARSDFQTFAGSTLGRVVLTLVGDVHTALLHMPDAFARVAPGPELHARELGAHSVRFTLAHYPGLIEYMVGQLEGVVLAFERSPTIVVHQVGADEFTFDVEHG